MKESGISSKAQPIDRKIVHAALAEAQVQPVDTDFDELVAYAGARYWHYLKVATINELSEEVFNRAVQLRLVEELKAYRMRVLKLTDEQDTALVKKMHEKYHFLAQATPEQHAAAKPMIEALSEFDQAVLILLKDGIKQEEIRTNLHVTPTQMIGTVAELRGIYQAVGVK